MSTALIPVSDMERMAQAFARSNLFGVKTVEQCMALMLLAQAENCHPAIAFRDFDIIQGKPAKKAEAMLRSFLDHEGSVEWHCMTDELADATFSHPKGGKARITWDMARAKKAGLGGKEMYTKFPRQMLANRTISEGCRRIYPASTSGMYEPGEVREIVREEKRAEKDMGNAQVVNDEPATPQATPPTVPSTQPAGDAAKISLEQAMDLSQALSELDPKAEVAFLKIAKLKRLDDLASSDYQKALDWVNRRKKLKNEAAQQV